MVKFLIKALVSAGLVWLLLSQVDADAVLARLLGVPAEVMVFAALTLFALSGVQAWRWWAIIRAIGAELGYRACWQNVLVGLFFNQTLPSSIGGDAVRIWRAYKSGLAVGPAVNGVLLDRVVGLGALLLIAALGLPKLFNLAGDDPTRWVAPIMVAGGFAGIAALVVFDRLPPVLLRGRVGAWAVAISADARRAFALSRYSAPAFGGSLFIHVTLAFVAFTVARGLDLKIDMIECLVLLPPVLLVSVVPISIAGWGVREGAMVTAFGFAGVPAADAFTLSVLFGLAAIASGLPGGLVWILTGGGGARTLIPEATPPGGRGESS